MACRSGAAFGALTSACKNVGCHFVEITRIHSLLERGSDQVLIFDWHMQVTVPFHVRAVTRQNPRPYF
jgi:hypothetical protein